MTPAHCNEKIFWVWSGRREREIAIRVQFSAADHNGCRVFSLGRREEWCV